MKIEMGESLFYSWLRHVKECQIVQTNWTTSSQWQLNNEERLEEIMTLTDKFSSISTGIAFIKKHRPCLNFSSKRSAMPLVLRSEAAQIRSMLWMSLFMKQASTMAGARQL